MVTPDEVTGKSRGVSAGRVSAVIESSKGVPMVFVLPAWEKLVAVFVF
jgi:hypothetical protein